MPLNQAPSLLDVGYVDFLRPGVVGSGDLQPTASGSIMTVTIAAGSAWIKDANKTYSTTPDLIRYTNSTLTSVILPNSDGTNPRIDQIFASVRTSVLGDALVNGSVTGTPTAGATLDNRSGVATLPNNALLLADVLVPAGSTAVTAGNTRDRRPWARGISYINQQTTSDFTTASTTTTQISANFQTRLECSGNPMLFTLMGQVANSTAAATVTLTIYMDGTSLGAFTLPFNVVCTSANTDYGITFQLPFTPSAGSHLFNPQWLVSAGTGTFRAGATKPGTFIVEELWPSGNNGTS